MVWRVNGFLVARGRIQAGYANSVSGVTGMRLSAAAIMVVRNFEPAALAQVTASILFRLEAEGG